MTSVKSTMDTLSMICSLRSLSFPLPGFGFLFHPPSILFSLSLSFPGRDYLPSIRSSFPCFRMMKVREHGNFQKVREKERKERERKERERERKMGKEGSEKKKAGRESSTTFGMREVPVRIVVRRAKDNHQY